jgi:hypothetical protein
MGGLLLSVWSLLCGEHEEEEEEESEKKNKRKEKIRNKEKIWKKIKLENFQEKNKR